MSPPQSEINRCISNKYLNMHKTEWRASKPYYLFQPRNLKLEIEKRVRTPKSLTLSLFVCLYRIYTCDVYKYKKYNMKIACKIIRSCITSSLNKNKEPSLTHLAGDLVLRQHISRELQILKDSCHTK